MGRGIGHSGRKGAFAFGARDCMLWWMDVSRIVFLLGYLGREIYPLIVAMKRIAHTKCDRWEHTLGNHGHLPML